jgi:hypothetical protein
MLGAVNESESPPLEPTRDEASSGEIPSASLPVSPAARKEIAGQHLGRYVLIEHLATGGMAEIFLAERRGEGHFAGFTKRLCLKTLQSRYADHPDVLGMFLEEARLAAKLEHPSIVDVYDVGEEGGAHYIAMEYIEGWTLNELVRRGFEVSRPLSLTHAVFIVAQMAEGLAHMHAAVDVGGEHLEIVHRDCSPSNLIVDRTGQTKIIDVGIAVSVAGRDGQPGRRPGKVSYMSPEQVTGGPVDARSDIFSLGTILYEITLGKRLWRGEAAPVMRRIVEEIPPPPTYVNRDYPRDLELVVQKALEKRPENRYQSAQELLEDLQRFLDKQGAGVTRRQVAQYLQDLHAPEVVVTSGGTRRARAFADDEGAGMEADGSPDDLDFDRGAHDDQFPPGDALADALRASGPLLPVSVLTSVDSKKADDRVGPEAGAGKGRPARARFWGVLLALAALGTAVWMLGRS